MTIAEMREHMYSVGFYRPADIEKICELEQAYLEECEDIAEDCQEQFGYSHGSVYDLRCEVAREWYDEQLEAIDKKYLRLNLG